MASGYTTSDGKDLDARYLGINGKSANAGYADSAGHANTATTATKANTLADGSIKNAGNPVKYDSGSNVISAPISGICFTNGGRINGTAWHNGTPVSDFAAVCGVFFRRSDGSDNSSSAWPDTYAFFINKGTKIYGEGWILPMKV